MKVDRIRLEGFLSHDLTDWSPNGARLVTLVGPNGAGKSTLASDALSYALFDEARGKTDQLVQLGATNMSVLVEFTFGDARYRVVRGRTTRSGGKSFLELHLATDDGWKPLTGDTIRDTEDAIANLLRLDAATFETAVLLGQGHANRFAEATAAERKRILGQVLGLEVYAKAEARARELARDIDARTTVQRDQGARLANELTARPAVEERLATNRGVVDEATAQIDIQHAAREEHVERIRVADAGLAAAEALAGQIAAVEAERADLGAQWHRASARRAAAVQQVSGAELRLAGAEAVADAAGRLEAASAQVAALVAKQAEDTRLVGDIAAKSHAVQSGGHDHGAAAADYRTRYEAARRRVDELAAAAAALQPVICEKCGHGNVVDQAGIRDALRDARAEFQALEGAEPKPPTGLLREKAALAALEAKRRALAFDPAALTALHGELAGLERLAARAESISLAQATIERERAAIVEVEQDLERIEAAGAAAKAKLEGLTAKLAETEPLRAERARLDTELTQVRSVIDQLERSRTIGLQIVARDEAVIEQLDRAQAQHDELVAALEADALEGRRLRRLVTAFGVTGIPARIIEGVLPELAGYANDIVADLRPGMTIELRAQRTKKDGSGVVEALDLVVRDDVGERPLAMFSGGERMSVSLALAGALSRLVARRAGTAIRTFVIDEPDGLDAEARRAFGQALRVLAHHGELERVVVVSHHEDLAEIGDAVYRVSKNGRGSVVEQVA